MSLAYKRFKVYLRVGLVLTIVLLGAWVLFKNRNHSVKLWFFGLVDPNKPTNVVWVMLFTAAITRTAWWLVSFSRGMIRDMREIRRQDAIDKADKARREREAALAERERQVDQKLKEMAGDNAGGVAETGGDGSRRNDVDEGEST
jgi:type VI protein secretion system component VasK